jgi:hypothetical protein
MNAPGLIAPLRGPFLFAASESAAEPRRTLNAAERASV